MRGRSTALATVSFLIMVGMFSFRTSAADDGTAADRCRPRQFGQFSEWGVPVNLGAGVNSAFRDRHPTISPNGLSLYITSDRPVGAAPAGTFHIWVSQRASLQDDWGPPFTLGPNINNPLGFAPNISPDGHWLFFAGGQLCGGGSPGNLWV